MVGREEAGDVGVRKFGGGDGNYELFELLILMIFLKQLTRRYGRCKTQKRGERRNFQHGDIQILYMKVVKENRQDICFT